MQAMVPCGRERLTSDDSTNRGAADHSRIAGDQAYELALFAQCHGLTSDQAWDLIAWHVDHRAKLEEAALTLKR